MTPARLPISRARAKLRGLNLHRPGEISGSIFNGSGGVKLCGAPRYPPGNDLLSALPSTTWGREAFWAGRDEYVPTAGGLAYGLGESFVTRVTRVTWLIPLKWEGLPGDDLIFVFGAGLHDCLTGRLCTDGSDN